VAPRSVASSRSSQHRFTFGSSRHAWPASRRLHRKLVRSRSAGPSAARARPLTPGPAHTVALTSFGVRGICLGGRRPRTGQASGNGAAGAVGRQIGSAVGSLRSRASLFKARLSSVHSAAAHCRSRSAAADLRSTARPRSRSSQLGQALAASRPMSNRRGTNVWPNPSVNPRPATASVVRPVSARGSIVAARPYNACLRGRGYLER
jgi:hypothetical protein